MEHILYWLWLTTKYGVTPSKIKVLLEYFKTVEEIYFSKNFNNIYGLSDKIKSSLADKDLSKAEKILEQTAKLFSDTADMQTPVKLTANIKEYIKSAVCLVYTGQGVGA